MPSVVEQESEGRRLSGLLSRDPVVGEGRLADGSRWTLRWSDHEASVARAVLAVAAPGAGHALVTIDLRHARSNRGLSAAWLSTPASSGPQLIGIVTGPGVDHAAVEPTPPEPGLSAPVLEAVTTERLYRDRTDGRSAFLVRGVARTDDVIVVGRDLAGGIVARTTVAGTGRDEPATIPALPEVSPAWGAGFTAVGVAAAVAVLGMVTLTPATVAARVVCGILGLLASALPPLRRAVARRQHALPKIARPIHHYLSQGTAMFTVWVAVMWMLNPTNTLVVILGGLAMAIVVTVDHRRLTARTRRRDRDADAERGVRRGHDSF